MTSTNAFLIVSGTVRNYTVTMRICHKIDDASLSVYFNFDLDQYSKLVAAIKSKTKIEIYDVNDEKYIGVRECGLGCSVSVGFTGVDRDGAFKIHSYTAQNIFERMKQHHTLISQIVDLALRIPGAEDTVMSYTGAIEKNPQIYDILKFESN